MKTVHLGIHLRVALVVFEAVPSVAKSMSGVNEWACSRGRGKSGRRSLEQTGLSTVWRDGCQRSKYSGGSWVTSELDAGEHDHQGIGTNTRRLLLQLIWRSKKSTTIH